MALNRMTWTRMNICDGVSHGWTRPYSVLKPGGAIFIYNLPQWAYHLAARLESLRMTFRHWIAVSMKGTFPRGRKLYPAHYALLYFTKGNPKTFNRVPVGFRFQNAVTARRTLRITGAIANS